MLIYLIYSVSFDCVNIHSLAVSFSLAIASSEMRIVIFRIILGLLLD